MAVTTVSNSSILRGWVTKVLKNGGKNRVADNNILPFFVLLYSIKNATFLFNLTRVCLFIKSEKLHFEQSLSIRICKVS